MPTGDELASFINDQVSPRAYTDCEFDRVKDLLLSEENEQGQDVEFDCDVLSTENYTEHIYNNINYRIPQGVSLQDFIAQCIVKEGHLVSKMNKDDFFSYSNSLEVQKMIEHLRSNTNKCLIPKNTYICEQGPPENRKNDNKPTGYCLSYVKRGVLAGTFTDTYPLGISAKLSGETWREMGFRNLLDSHKYKDMTPYTAPKGAILVYEGGKYGHVEVKASDNEFISDYVGEKPIYDELNLPRKIIGIYVR